MQDVQLPSYISLSQNGLLKEKAAQAHELFSCCKICPRKCGVNRLKDEKGFCLAGSVPVISSYNAHFGEEPPISGTFGSGTIFFTHCHLRCVYCQNYPISQMGNGTEVSIGKLAEIMLFLQKKKCHNINLVSGTIYVPHILKALAIAAENGLRIPIVYNTGGYESIETLKFLEGVVDIYLPDAKYSQEEQGKKYSSVHNYWEVNQQALKEMYRQAGELALDEQGIARRGLIVRHLVLPHGIAGSIPILEFIANLSAKIHVSVMSQYQPRHKAGHYDELNRTITASEYEEVTRKLHELRLENGWVQEQLNIDFDHVIR